MLSTMFRAAMPHFAVARCCPALTQASAVCLQGGVLKKTVVGVQGPELVQAVTTLSDLATGGV